MTLDRDVREGMPYDCWTVMILSIIYLCLILAMIYSSQHHRDRVADDPVTAEAPDQ